MARAAIYARYSSEQQRSASIEDQVRLCRARIEREGWTLAATYTDHAISGASMLRPGYQKLMEDARAGGFGVVIAEALDRLSRDQEDTAALYKRLHFAGVRIVTLAEGEISELHVGLKGTMNALFLKDLAEKTRRGLEGRVRAGRSGGGLCYGYEVVEGGEVDRGARRILTQEAENVCRIFTAFANGASPRRIAIELNRDGVPGPQGERWQPSTINGNAARGTGILNNELYIGRLVWNRLRYIKDPSTGRRVSRVNDAERLVVSEVPHLRIIEQDLWDWVKQRQASLRVDTRPDAKADRPFWDRQRPRYLFSGLVKCGICGGGYSKISANLFGCANARNTGTCDNRRNIRRDRLEASILDGLKSRLMEPELFKIFAEEFFKEVNRLRSTQTVDHDAKRAELARVEQRLKRMVDAIAEGAPVRSVKDELMSLEARREILEREIAEAGSEPAKPLIHPNMAELYRRKVAELEQALQDTSIRDEAFDLIRSLVERITLTPEGEEGLRIELKGEIAAMLALASNSKKPGQTGRAIAEQIKLVAGAGFEPATFRL